METDSRLQKLGRQLTPAHVANTKVYAGRDQLLASFPQGGDYAELGVAEGYFSEAILRICQPRRLHLIDLWSSKIEIYDEASMQGIQTRLATQIAAGQVVLHRGYSWDMLSQLPDQSLDCVYVDADHSYEGAKKDLLTAAPKMKPGGIIAGHDYVKWSTPTGRFGVVEAVNEFCLDFSWEMVGLTLQPNMHLSFALRRMS